MDSVGGVIGVAQIAGEAASDGPLTLLALTAVLSVNIALMNLLPIPVPDDEALILCSIEMVGRRQLSPTGSAIGDASRYGHRRDDDRHGDAA